MNSPNDNLPNLSRNYKSNFNNAIAFTKTKYFNLDSQCVTDPSEEMINQLINEFSNLISKQLHVFKNNNIGEIANFGGQCGNVHHNLIGFIKMHYPLLCANLTIGDVDSGGPNNFIFSQIKCEEWLKNRSHKILDCHVWITIGNNFIIDATIGTFQNTRSSNNVLKDKSAFAYGGIIFGKINDLKFAEIKNVKNSHPANFTKFIYTPVILGAKALVALAPKFNATNSN